MYDVPSLGRFPGLPASALDAEQRAALAELVDGRGAVPAPYRFLIVSPKLVRHLGALGTDLRNGGELTKREMEIVILATAHHLRCEFVEATHRRLAKSVGLPEGAIDAILSGGCPALPDERERLVHALTRSLHEKTGIPPEEAETVERHLGRKVIAEIIALIGIYTVTCYTMRFVDAQAPPQSFERE